MANTIGLLHPGSMGSAVGAQLRHRGHTVLRCPDGRSTASHHRAEHAASNPRPFLTSTNPDLMEALDALRPAGPGTGGEHVDR